MPNSPSSETISVADKNEKTKVSGKKSHQKEGLKQPKEFVVGYVDNTKEFKKLYSQDAGDASKPKNTKDAVKPKGKSTQKATSKPDKRQVSSKKSKKDANKEQITPVTNEDLDQVGDVIELNEDFDSSQVDGRLTPVPRTPIGLDDRIDEVQQPYEISDDADSDDDLYL